MTKIIVADSFDGLVGLAGLRAAIVEKGIPGNLQDETLKVSRLSFEVAQSYALNLPPDRLMNITSYMMNNQKQYFKQLRSLDDQKKMLELFAEFNRQVSVARYFAMAIYALKPELAILKPRVPYDILVPCDIEYRREQILPQFRK